LFSYSDNNKCITFKPESSFNYLEKYKVTLSGDIEDHTGKRWGRIMNLDLYGSAWYCSSPNFQSCPGTYLGEQVIESTVVSQMQ
jgi:hypothetical protein